MTSNEDAVRSRDIGNNVIISVIELQTVVNCLRFINDF